MALSALGGAMFEAPYQASIAALTGRTEVRFADSTLVSQAISGTPCELEFSWTLISGESLTLTVHAVYLPRPRIEIGGPQGIQASFDWQAARDAGLPKLVESTRARTTRVPTSVAVMSSMFAVAVGRAHRADARVGVILSIDARSGKAC